MLDLKPVFGTFTEIFKQKQGFKVKNQVFTSFSYKYQGVNC